MNSTNSAALSGSFCHYKLPEETQKIEIITLGMKAQNLAEQRPRVLVVDDERIITDVVEKALNYRLKAQVTKAFDGAEATQYLEANDYDLIISDMRMPIMTGLSLYEWMQDHTPALCSRFFMMSGDLGGPEIAGQLSTLGVKVLKKPFSMDTLVGTCRDYLESFSPRPSAVLTH